MEAIWICIGAMAVFFIFYAILIQTQRRGRLPSPPSLPVIGHLHLLSNLPHQDLGRLSNRYGPLFSLRLGVADYVVASSPQMAKEFLKIHDAIFASRPQFDVGRIIGYNYMSPGWAHYGNHWKHIRAICIQQLFTVKKVQETKHIRTEEITCTLQSIMEDSLENRVVNLSSILSNLSTNVITRMAIGKKFFGKNNAEGAEHFKEMIDEVFFLMGAFNIADYLPFLAWFDLQGYRRRMEVWHLKFDAFLHQIVEEELQKISKDERDKTHNLVRVLLQAEGEEEGSKLQIDAVKATIMDILIAGTDTNSVTVTWAVAELIRSPVIMKRVQQELDDVVGSQRFVDEDDVPNLPLLHAVVKETFRLHPAGPLLVPHKSIQDCSIANYHIPKGTHLIVNVWQMGRDPKIWKEPHVFDPERFINSRIDVKGRDFELIPFSSGRRSCPGMSLALPLVHINLARLLQMFNLEAVEEVELNERFGLTLPMAKPLLVIAKPRSNLALLH